MMSYAVNSPAIFSAPSRLIWVAHSATSGPSGALAKSSAVAVGPSGMRSPRPAGTVRRMAALYAAKKSYRKISWSGPRRLIVPVGLKKQTGTPTPTLETKCWIDQPATLSSPSYGR